MIQTGVVLGLSAVIVSVAGDSPLVLTTRLGGAPLAALPFGPFDPVEDRTLELSLRRWVSEQTGFDIGYVEQLYTFGDRGREAPPPGETSALRVLSVGYLALTPKSVSLGDHEAGWRDWYRFFPYEDWRGGRPEAIDALIAPALEEWARRGATEENRRGRWSRARLAFALEGAPWNEERTLERYELLYEAGLAPEAAVDAARFRSAAPPARETPPLALGEAMNADHRRILATAISRLRGKIKYRPIIFELAPERFTLSHLQRVVEAVSGIELHKQNFRRLLERSHFVEGTGEMEAQTGGRPAELFRFRRAALNERPAGGVSVPQARE